MKAESWYFWWIIGSIAFCMAFLWLSNKLQELREAEDETQRAIAKILQCRPPDD